MQLSNKVNRIKESGIRKVFDMATSIGPDAINLSIGQPHFKTPFELKKAGQTAIRNNFNAYMPTKGYLPLREKIASKLNKENDIQADKEDIIITAGVSGGLFLLFSSVLNKGDEVILSDPYFVLYTEILKYLGVKIVLHNTYPDFRLKADKLEKLITKKTKMIIVNSPNNPTGIVYSQSELEELAQVAEKHDLLIVSDEIYETFDYKKKFFSIGSIYKNTVTLNGFSKNLSITGWRIGYAHGPSEIIEAMNKLQMYSFVCAPSVAERAVSQTMDADIPVFDYTKNRDYLYSQLKDKYELSLSEGAFYAFVRVPEIIDDFYDKLIDQKLLIVPGNVFSDNNDYFRISFAVDFELLQKGVKILKNIS
jgi:aspartate aminotransferase/aminotransferase